MSIIPVSCGSDISVRQLKEVKAKIERFFTDRMSVRGMDNPTPLLRPMVRRSIICMLL